MKHTYKLSGLHCKGCAEFVTNELQKIENIISVKVHPDKEIVDIEMHAHVPIDKLKQSIQKDGLQYDIVPIDSLHIVSQTASNKHEHESNAIYYCPMHCEGDKTYPQPGNCPVCGMNLVQKLKKREDIDSELDVTYIDLKNKLVVATIFTLPIFIIAMTEMAHNNPLKHLASKDFWNWTQFVLSIPVVFYATRMFFVRAWSSIIRKSPNMFTLIGLGAGIAWGYSLVALLTPSILPKDFTHSDGSAFIYIEASCVILTLVLLGQVIELRAHGKTNKSIKALISLAPKFATRIEEGKDVQVPIDEIKKGDILRIKPGNKIPVDGIIINGESFIDYSLITGEPIPLRKTKGNHVVSGTINGKHSFAMKAEKIGAESMLAQIIELVNKAISSRAPIQKIADIISKWFVPIVVIISVSTFTIWAIWGPEPKLIFAFINAIAVLIIACPCALGLATPMSVMVSIGKGAQSGILIKNAEALELLNKIDTLIIDKTGTITEGKPTVENIISFTADYSTNELMQLCTSLNMQSEHPIADAMVKYSKANAIELKEAKNFVSHTGKGVSGEVSNISIVVGNRKLLEELKIKINAVAEKKISKELTSEKTTSFICVNNRLAGLIIISDAIKKTSKASIQEIQKSGIDVIMLTGDNETNAKYVANEVGITHFKANFLPKDKQDFIQNLQDTGRTVAMAGDGINDAPALAVANVSIAMATGTDVAIESAQIILMNGDLNGIAKVVKLSHVTIKNIKQNLFFALIYNALGIPLAAGLLYPFFGILLSPMIAALAMSFSSVSVIANSLRLRAVHL